MKTAEELIDEIQQDISMGPYEYLDFKDCVKAMNNHAIQALHEVARRWHTNKLQRGYDTFKTLDEIILEIKKELK